MISLDYNQAHGFVSKQQRRGVNVRWSGWDMVFFKADRRANRSPKGRRLGNEWGFETIVSPNNDGKWLVNYRLARGANV